MPRPDPATIAEEQRAAQTRPGQPDPAGVAGPALVRGAWLPGAGLPGQARRRSGPGPAGRGAGADLRVRRARRGTGAAAWPVAAELCAPGTGIGSARGEVAAA